MHAKARLEHPLRVLVAHPGADLYGSDRIVLESVRGMVTGGVSVVVTLPNHGPLEAELTTLGAAVIICPTPVIRKDLLTRSGILRFAGNAFEGFFAGLNLIRSCKPDAIYVSTLTLPMWIVLSRVRGIPVLAHVHEAESKMNRTLRAMLATPLVLATTLIANSRFTADTLEESFGPLRGRSEVVYNGIAGPSVAKPARIALTGGIRVLYMGRISARKGVDIAINAIALVRKRGLDASLDIVGAVFPGGESYEQSLTDLIRREGLEGFVRFHGFQNDIWAFLAHTDAVIVPARSDESFGNTPVEALLAARPVIVSAISGLKEAAAGYLSVQFVEPEDIIQAADAILILSENWEDYSARAREDRSLAEDRHKPLRYRRDIVAAIAKTAGRPR